MKRTLTNSPKSNRQEFDINSVFEGISTTLLVFGVLGIVFLPTLSNLKNTPQEMPAMSTLTAQK